MMNRPGLWLPALLLVLSGGSPTGAQTIRILNGERLLSGQSHVPIPGGSVTPEMAEAFFRNRLQNAQTFSELEKLAREILQNRHQYNLPQEELDRLAHGEVDLNNPALKGIVEDRLDNMPAEQKERFQDFLRQFDNRSEPRENPFVPVVPPRNDSSPPPSVPPEVTPQPPPSSGPPSGRPSGPPPELRPQTPPPSPRSGSNTRVSEELRRVGDRLMKTPLKDSPTLQRVVSSLANRISANGTDWTRRQRELERSFIAWGQRLPTLSWPRSNWVPRNLRLRGGANAPILSADPGRDAFPVGLLLVGMALLVIVFALLRRYRGGLLGRELASWRLGPWPVRPEAVRTRADLVRAFEYLALLLLGPAARSWNHRDIAVALGNQGGRVATRRDAAERLAALYEHARYAPPDDVLTDAELAWARRDLSILARAATA
jgi:hypothetical protein